jgi:hypothetical protein
MTIIENMRVVECSREVWRWSTLPRSSH